MASIGRPIQRIQNYKSSKFPNKDPKINKLQLSSS